MFKNLEILKFNRDFYLVNFYKKKMSTCVHLFDNIYKNSSYYINEGIVLSVGDGIAKVRGLKWVQAGELVILNNSVKGMALNLEKQIVGIVLFGNDRNVSEQHVVDRTHTIVNIPVGKELLGRVIDCLGNFIDGRIRWVLLLIFYKFYILVFYKLMLKRKNMFFFIVFVSFKNYLKFKCFFNKFLSFLNVILALFKKFIKDFL